MRENIELVRRAMVAAGKRPKPDYNTVNALFHPEHVFVPAQVGRSEVKGGAGYKTWLEEGKEILPFEMEFDGAIEIPPRHVLAETTMQFHGASSGIDIEQRLWLAITLSEGKIARTEAYVDAPSAIAALGMVA